MKDKICLITGSTSGIGKATAEALAAKGAVVIVVGRSPERGEEVAEDIKRRMHNQQVFFEQCDLSSLKSVKDLAYRINKNFPRIDILINNAGCFTQDLQYTEDGIEMQFGVNHVAHFLLTHLLLPSFQKSEAVRILNVSSAMHSRAKINFEDIYNETSYNGMRAYAQSKLANVLFTYELARKYKEENIEGITVNALHPGAVGTGFGAKNSKPLMKTIWKAVTPFMLTENKGAETSVYLASSKEVEGVTSKYWAKKRAVSSSNISYNEQVAERLWNISKALSAQFWN